MGEVVRVKNQKTCKYRIVGGKKRNVSAQNLAKVAPAPDDFPSKNDFHEFEVTATKTSDLPSKIALFKVIATKTSDLPSKIAQIAPAPQTKEDNNLISQDNLGHRKRWRKMQALVKFLKVCYVN